jgi:hypothetical protein
VKDPLWVCKDGKALRVKEMTDSHLANSIAKIQRSREGWRRKWLDRLLLEKEIRSLGIKY